jgi:hypothetical protein
VGQPFRCQHCGAAAVSLPDASERERLERTLVKAAAKRAGAG